MTIRFDTLANRIFLSFIVLLVLVVGALLTMTTQSTYKHSLEQLNSHFKTSQASLEYRLLSDSRALKQALVTMSRDFNTKHLIAGGTEDPSSLKFAIENHRKRSKADFLVVLDQQKKTLVEAGSVGGQLIFEVDQFEEHSINWLSQAGSIYLINLVPVYFVESQSAPNAWILAAKHIDSLVTEEIKTSVGFDISISSGVQYTRHLNSTEMSMQRFEEVFKFDHGDEQWLGYNFRLGAETYPLNFSFVTPYDQALVNYKNLKFKLLFMLSVLVILCFAFSYLLSWGISRPLSGLVDIANKIKKGDYGSEIPPAGAAEIASLSDALGSMQTAIKAREGEIQKLAFYDELTGLPNRTQFLTQVEKMIQDSNIADFSVIILDVDRFKDVNDTLGHELGDKLLFMIGERIQSLNFDSIFAAHFSADQFAMLVSNQARDDVERFTRALLDTFETSFILKTVKLDVDIRLGVARYPDDGKDCTTIMKCADIALYSCKDLSDRVLWYESKLNKHSVQRLTRLSELRKAIEEDQLTLVYQPKIALKTGEVMGMECLVRWHHPEQGFIFPDEFIPLAEQSGAIRELTHWVLKTAAKQFMLWSGRGLTIPMSVNVSALDLVDQKLQDYVARLLEDWQIDPAYLILEITESAVMSEPQQAMYSLYHLKEMGIKLSIDDFGTGYSSMAQLKSMPVTELKIDKSFIQDLSQNSDDQAIVKSTVELAHNLGLSIVAEGIENEAALTILKDYGVENVQGYFFSKPLSAQDFYDWVIAWNEKKSQFPGNGTEMSA